MPYQSASVQILQKCPSPPICALSLVSMFFLDLNGPLPGCGPGKETSLGAPVRRGLTPIGNGPELPLLELLPPYVAVEAVPPRAFAGVAVVAVSTAAGP